MADTLSAAAQNLAQSDHLTPFQAKVVAAGKAASLILGEYTILDRIGAGGMGQVFKALHRRMDRIVAIKVLPPNMTKDAPAVARFEQEARAAAKLAHPNIVAAHDAGEAANGVHFLVMEYVEGTDLSQLVKKDGPFSVSKAVNYILQAARGLEYAHKKGVVHRDIKPSNLLLDKEGTVKVLDMGLARIASDGNAVTQAELTGTGTIMGTVDYMSPEQSISTKHADARADIYALGCSLYYLLTGKTVYVGETISAKLIAHHNSPIPELRAECAAVSEQLEVVFHKMVAKRVEDRYQTMSEVIDALDHSSTDWNCEATVAFLPQVEIKKKHWKKVVGGLLVSVAAVAACVSFDVVSFGAKDAEPLVETNQVVAADPVVVTPQVETPIEPKVETADSWVVEVQAMPPTQQIEAVRAKLIELNPGFDGRLTAFADMGSPKIENGVVVELEFKTDNVTDISPVRALTGLRHLKCFGSQKGIGKLKDLSPLAGLSLVKLELARNEKIADLTPIQKMSLSYLNIGETSVSDLTPLAGMPLTYLNCNYIPVRELSALRGMPLAEMACYGCPVSDISALAECTSLTKLKVEKTNLTTAQIATLQAALPNCKITK